MGVRGVLEVFSDTRSLPRCCRVPHIVYRWWGCGEYFRKEALVSGALEDPETASLILGSSGDVGDGFRSVMGKGRVILLEGVSETMIDCLDKALEDAGGAAGKTDLERRVLGEGARCRGDG